MTRVTLVSYDDAPPLGGQGVVVCGMRAALVSHGHRVDTVSGRGEHAIAFPRVTGRAPLDLSLHLNRRPAVITHMGGDVVHAHGGPGGVLLLRRFGTPMVYTAHHTYAQASTRGSLRRLMAPLEARAYRGADMVLAVSPSTAQSVRRMGIPADRVEVLPPGVEIPPLSARVTEPGRLLFAGRWESEKGVLDAVAVMRELIQRHTQVSAAVVGAGRLGDEVRRAAAGSPVEVLGRVSDARLQEEFARAAVVLMPSAYEGLGLVALEAQAAGAVVAGYDVDGLRDAALEPGLLVPRGDVSALTAVVARLLDAPQARIEIAERVATTMRTQHSWDAVARRLDEVYTSVRSRH